MYPKDFIQKSLLRNSDVIVVVDNLNISILFILSSYRRNPVRVESAYVEKRVELRNKLSECTIGFALKYGRVECLYGTYVWK